MFDQRLREIWIALLLACATVAPASADGPRAGFKLDQKATVFISPDKKVRVEQYAKDNKDTGLLYQFWTFDADHRHAFLLNPGEGDDLAGYAAGFRFSPDSQWLVRMQKLGAGYQTLFLYRRNGHEFSSATPKPLGDLTGDPAISRTSHSIIDLVQAQHVCGPDRLAVQTLLEKAPPLAFLNVPGDKANPRRPAALIIH